MGTEKQRVGCITKGVLEQSLVALQAVALQTAAQAKEIDFVLPGAMRLCRKSTGGGQVPKKTEDGVLMGRDRYGRVAFSQHCFLLAHRCATQGGYQSGRWLSSEGCGMNPQK